MKSRLLSLLFFFFPSFLFACSCLYFTSFCEAMNPGSIAVGLRVTNVYFVDQGGVMSMWIDGEVIDELVGEAPNDVLSIQITDNTSCSPDFPPNPAIGDRVAVFVESSSGIGPNGFEAYSVVSGCTAKARYFSSVESYTEFRNNINDCILLTKTVDKELLDKLTPFAPNPARDLIKIRLWLPLNLDITIYGANGQLVYQGKIRQEPEFEINISDWASGVYYVRFQSEDTQLVKRFLKTG
ncbi:MAG: T9SS type A sorting domain-containing protein [Bacteroidota bacterium]